MGRDFPIFVPFEEGRLAAIVTVPDVPPRALVLLLQGLGSPRSHRYQLWTRTAAGLAERGIASVRMDYPQMGDSIGTLPTQLEAPPVAEAMAVARLALDALGVQRLGVVGNCLGARAAFGVAAQMDSCDTVLCIIPDTVKALLHRGGRTKPRQTVARAARRVPRAARLARRVLHWDSTSRRLRYVPEVITTLQTADVLFLVVGVEQLEHRFRADLKPLLRASSSERRTQIRHVASGHARGMRLPLETQPMVVDAVVRWMDEIFPPVRSKGHDSTAAGHPAKSSVPTAPAQTHDRSRASQTIRREA